MATVIEELVSRLGFQIDDKKLDQFNKRSERLKTNLKQIGVIVSAGAIGITTWVSRVGIATDANIKFADSVGIAFDALQELQFATEREGGSLQSLQSSLLALSQRAGEAFRGMGEGVVIFGLLGVEIRDANGQIKTADVLLGDLADAFQGFDRVRQIEFANKLGISPDLLLLLQKGGDNLRMLKEEARSLGLVTEETARNSEIFQDSLTDLRFTVRSVFTNIAGELLPTIIDLAEQLKDWFQLNKAIVKQNVTKFVKGVTMVTTILVKNMRFLVLILASIAAIKIVGFFTNLVTVIITLTGAVIGLNSNLTITQALMGFLPLLVGLIIAAIIALVLVIQDLKVFSEGGDSFFGRMAEDSDKARRNVERTIAVFKKLESALEIIGQIAKDAWDSIKSIVDILGSLGDIATNFFTGIPNTIKKDILGLQGLLGKVGIDFTPRAEMLGRGVGQTNNNNATTNITAPITVNSASGDAAEIAETVQGAIEELARRGIKNQPVTVNR